MNALMFEKRIIVYGTQSKTQDISNIVLSLAALLPLTNISSRMHPYVSLGNLDFLTQRGFICGTTNALFEQRSSWWDICINLNTKQVEYGSNAKSSSSVSYQPTNDKDMFQYLEDSIFNAVQSTTGFTDVYKSNDVEDKLAKQVRTTIYFERIACTSCILCRD